MGRSSKNLEDAFRPSSDEGASFLERSSEGASFLLPLEGKEMSSLLAHDGNELSKHKNNS
jgi:hypothetical protein